MLAALRRRGLTLTDQEDITQETYEKWMRWLKRNPDASLEHRVAVAVTTGNNLAINLVRDAARHATVVADVPENASVDVDQDRVEDRDSLQRLAPVIDSLPVKAREAIHESVRRELEGETTAGKGAERVRLSRARGKLEPWKDTVLGVVPAWRWRRWGDDTSHAAVFAGSVLVVGVVGLTLSHQAAQPTSVAAVMASSGQSEVSPTSAETSATSSEPAAPPSAERMTTSSFTHQPSATAEGDASAPPPARVIADIGTLPTGPVVVVTGHDRRGSDVLVCTGTGGSLPSFNHCIDHPLRPGSDTDSSP